MGRRLRLRLHGDKYLGEGGAFVVLRMRVLPIIMVLFLLVTGLARAADFPVTDDDQKSIAAICTIAAKSPLTNDQQTASIANWCVMWGNRMQAAEKAKAAGGKPVDNHGAEPK